MRTQRFLLVVLVGLGVVMGVAAAQAPAPSPPQHIVLPTTKMNWGPSPPGLPAGAQTAVLSGDPGKAGEAFTISVKMPDGYVVPPHWHPTTENMVVISGKMQVGTGDSINEASMTTLGPGGYGMMAPKMHHYVKAIGATTVVLYGTGPFEITYVNPNDDPRKVSQIR